MLIELTAYSDIGLFVLRCVVGLIFLYHGFPKLQKSNAMASGIGMPASAVVLLGTVESVSALALILGAWVQYAALALAVVMMGATYKKITAWQVPFSSHTTTGWEFDLMLFAANIAILLTGGGVIRLL